ncbi:electron transfer flavoprotein-ubiquinone oxidoreductase [Rhizomicrobium electricum]|uniref:Electron transfer flavoprotein-ubiquinone oxidoreductase n=1 Tax=Rhizomicrobium electricum TaxID=480070 RepID=A0ABN1E133_9PROT|nr:electron transfer flavoprotein-ubiquinone oxidoreductase [Rhizomicrobium electricum]NIJ47319.1 electron-transferring-flavoprotein dehydrogenase [Rhizomicrobium electricum]
MTDSRESMEFDVVIVGGGPAGLAAAIRLKQRAAAAGREVSVCLLEKGAEIGAHILSGAVIDPVALNALIPDWRQKGAPLDTPVTEDRFHYLTETRAFRIPNVLMPPLMSNHGMEIASLSNLCRWLGGQAEALGVEIYPGFPAADILYEDGAVAGVVSGDFGVAKDGHHKDTYTPGMELRAKYTLFAEGARGHLTKRLIERFGLGRGVQKYGIGLKELWEIDPAKHQRGLVEHTMGWPLDNRTGGGSFLYHWGEQLCAIGMVIHLDYKNPNLSPFDEFQRFKLHPLIRPMLEGGKRINYGARVVSEGGFQSVPKLTFPGGALIGCGAGFMNVPRIKGTHNAMASAMLAADGAFDALGAGGTLEAYETAYRTSAVYRELKLVRNVKPLWSRFGTVPGVALGGLDMWTNQLFGVSLFGTLAHAREDADTLVPAKDSPPIAYPRPDGVLTFDRLSGVYLSGTNHEEDQPVHLLLTEPSLPVRVNLPKYNEPAQRYCPAGVYEIVEGRFQINAPNCVHCKTCDIKDPSHNITWVAPEGGGGPRYSNM